MERKTLALGFALALAEGAGTIALAGAIEPRRAGVTNEADSRSPSTAARPRDREGEPPDDPEATKPATRDASHPSADDASHRRKNDIGPGPDPSSPATSWAGDRVALTPSTGGSWSDRGWSASGGPSGRMWPYDDPLWNLVARYGDRALLPPSPADLLPPIIPSTVGGASLRSSGLGDPPTTARSADSDSSTAARAAESLAPAPTVSPIAARPDVLPVGLAVSDPFGLLAGSWAAHAADRPSTTTTINLLQDAVVPLDAAAAPDLSVPDPPGPVASFASSPPWPVPEPSSLAAWAVLSACGISLARWSRRGTGRAPEPAGP